MAVVVWNFHLQFVITFFRQMLSIIFSRGGKWEVNVPAVVEVLGTGRISLEE